MKGKNKKKNDNAVKTAKSTNRLVKFWVFGGITLIGLGIAAGGVAIAQRQVYKNAMSKVYTVEFDSNSDSIKGVRKDDAVGMVAGINGAKNDFDNVYPWKAIKDVTDENGDVFVRIPKYYVKNTLVEAGKFTISISPEARKGYHIAPAFAREENGEMVISDYIDVGKYEASLTEDQHLKSVSGVYPMVDELNISEARTIAEADGNELFDWRQNLAVQTLFMVEFATPDSQGLMSGLTQGLYYKHVLTADDIAAKKIKTIPVVAAGSNLMDSTTDKVKFIKANTGRVDIKMDHPSDDEDEVFNYKASNLKATGVMLNEEENDIASITLEKELNVEKMEVGEEVNIWFGAGFYHKTGEADNAKGSSNGASQKSNEVKAMSYRGIENWYGNTFTLIDGLFSRTVESEDTIFVSNNPKNHGDRESYIALTQENTIKEFALYEFDATSEDEPWLYDYYNIYFDAETDMIGGIGGGFDRNADGGIFCLGVHFAAATRQASFRIASTN